MSFRLPVPLALLVLGPLLLAGCGDPPRERAGEVAPGAACTRSEQCPIDFTCAGCSEQDTRCVAGCGSDGDCSTGHCEQVACITCPCPGSCAR